MRDFFEKLIRLVFPPKCIFCGRVLPIDTGIGICPGCLRMLPFMDEKLSVLDRKNASKSYCDSVICVFRYDSIVRQAVVRYKFFGKSYYYRTLGRLLSEKIKKMTNFREFDIIISVPLYKDKENVRGYNQSLLLAKVLSSELNIPEQSRFLERVRNTDSQSLTPACKRYINVKGAFKVVDCSEVKGKVVLLIDDVLTTGNTLNECSRVLKEAGAGLVVAGVIATGRH